VELASMLLLAGLVGAYHIGRRQEQAGKPDERAPKRADESLTGKGADQ
jgi:hypothetical protein